MVDPAENLASGILVDGGREGEVLPPPPDPPLVIDTSLSVLVVLLGEAEPFE